MKFLSILAPLSLVVATAATAIPRDGSKYGLTQEVADDIVAKFITILDHQDPVAANATAQALLAEGYTEISDSILSLEGQPVS